MMYLLGVILILGILLWRMDSRLEWTIPVKWQTFIRTWKEGMGARAHRLNYIWYLDPRESELEKRFWHLQKELPQLGKKVRAPLWVEVRIVHQGVPNDQKEIYLSCLQRRFPEIEIYE